MKNSHISKTQAGADDLPDYLGRLKKSTPLHPYLSARDPYQRARIT